jgi:hypothetical protein
MVETTEIGRRKVVNLAEYRAARAVRDLPFETSVEASLAPALPPAPARPLRPDQVEHRERMLRHLAGR